MTFLFDRAMIAIAHSSLDPLGSSRPTQMGKVHLGWVVLLLLVGGIFWWQWRLHSEVDEDVTGGNTGVMQMPTQSVAVETVKRQDLHLIVHAIGSIAPSDWVIVKAKADGELIAVHFKEGQVVKAGTLLAEIDARAQRIALIQAEGQLMHDKAQLKGAQQDLQRFNDLLKQEGGIAKQQVDNQKALVEQLRGLVQSNQAAVAKAQLELSYTRVVAPITGRVGLKQVDVGNTVRSTDENGLVSLVRTEPVRLIFSVSENYLARIQEQLNEGQHPPVEAWDQTQKIKLATGKVMCTDNTIDPATGTIKLKADFTATAGQLFAKQSVNVRLQLGILPDALTVPSSAIVRGTQDNFVYRVNADRTVTKVRVLTGPEENEWVSIVSATPLLKVGDKVVTEGVDRLRDGARVRVPTSSAFEAAVRAEPAASETRPHAPHRRRAAHE